MAAALRLIRTSCNHIHVDRLLPGRCTVQDEAEWSGVATHLANICSRNGSCTSILPIDVLESGAATRRKTEDQEAEKAGGRKSGRPEEQEGGGAGGEEAAWSISQRCNCKLNIVGTLVLYIASLNQQSFI
ncbi:hypothetical protein PUN28_001943 [Cardiocondyla obscurior]|uniref:Uncharacterized protein n=1 Tax=Cardiocondyla obscurior TaxID=286306 RepID=A0AAW2GRU2_9HYME